MNYNTELESAFLACEAAVTAALDAHPMSFTRVENIGVEHHIAPWTLGLFLETTHVRRQKPSTSLGDVWQKAAHKLERIMFTAITRGRTGENPLQVLSGDWARRLSGRNSILGAGGLAFRDAVAVQEFNAGMGLIAAAPTGGASGTLPGTIWAVGEAVNASFDTHVEALFVAGLVGLVAFRRGPVSGAQSGCGGEIGIAAGMAAGAAAWLLGGQWTEIASAAALAASNFVGLECSPAKGFVEYPCIPRNGFAAVCAVAAAEAACSGIQAPYTIDETFDRIFGIGRLLPESLRETEPGRWMGTFLGEG